MFIVQKQTIACFIPCIFWKNSKKHQKCSKKTKIVCIFRKFGYIIIDVWAHFRSRRARMSLICQKHGSEKTHGNFKL